MNMKRKNEAFTLTELLLVMSIVTVLFSMAFPAFKNIREASRSSMCLSNIRQLGMGLMAYAGDNSGFLPPANISTNSAMTPDMETWGGMAWDYFGLGPYKSGSNDMRYTGRKGSSPNIFVCPKTRAERIFLPGSKKAPGGNHCYAMQVQPVMNIYHEGSWSRWEFGHFQMNKAWIHKSSLTALIVEDVFSFNDTSSFFNRSGLVPHRQGMNTLFYDGHVEWISHKDIPLSGDNPFWGGKGSY